MTCCHQVASCLTLAGFIHAFISYTVNYSITLCIGEWRTPNITGQTPYPVDDCTLTPVGERRAALFGGRSGSRDVSDELLIVELSRDTVVSVIRF